MARRGVDGELLAAATAAIRLVVARVYEKRLRKMHRQLRRALAEAAIRDAEQVVRDAAGRLNDGDEC